MEKFQEEQEGIAFLRLKELKYEPEFVEVNGREFIVFSFGGCTCSFHIKNDEPVIRFIQSYKFDVDENDIDKVSKLKDVANRITGKGNIKIVLSNRDGKLHVSSILDAVFIGEDNELPLCIDNCLEALATCQKKFFDDMDADHGNASGRCPSENEELGSTSLDTSQFVIDTLSEALDKICGTVEGAKYVVRKPPIPGVSFTNVVYEGDEFLIVTDCQAYSVLVQFMDIYEYARHTDEERTAKLVINSMNINSTCTFTYGDLFRDCGIVTCSYTFELSPQTQYVDEILAVIFDTLIIERAVFFDKIEEAITK